MMTLHRSFRGELVIVLGGLLLASACTGEVREPNRADRPVVDSPSVAVLTAQVGQELPAFKLATLGRDSVTFGSRRRQPVTLLTLWFTTCAPCIREFPFIDSLHQRYASGGLRVLGVSSDQTDAQVRAFLMQRPVSFAIARDPGNSVMKALRAEGWPQNVLVSATGRILYMGWAFHGAPPPVLVAAIESALKEQPVEMTSLR
jgi:peroxiredoxin